MKARVILFKESGKYYTEEDWTVPEGPESIGPHCMRHSPDFRRIGGGAVLVDTQEPWGFPCLFNSVLFNSVGETSNTVKKQDIAPGFDFSGYCGGRFGRDSYGERVVLQVDPLDRWVLLSYTDYGHDGFDLFQVPVGGSATEDLAEIVTDQMRVDEANGEVS
ncbi:MAG: hypothetical protein GY773_10065 [Actinomycetia bacterium]|nr:hypothetical protein [Actinomycetes bacterium]